MMNVSWKTLSLSILLLGTLSGCLSTPEVSVSSLGKKLPAPLLKGTSPFEQNVDTIGYAHIEGTCDARIGLISLSFDNKVWHQVPAQPDLTGTSLSTTTVNDNDCSSDGAFNIYITKSDLSNIWGIVTGNGGTNVDYIYIKGSTLIGDTEVLTIVDTKDSDDGGSSSAASTILLEKTWPSGGAGVGKCGYFTASVVNNDLKQTSYASAITFNIRISKAGTNSTFRGYNSWSECEADSTNSANTDTFTFNAQQTSKQIVYRFPSNSVGDVLSFTVVNQSALAAGPATSVTLKSPYGNDRWLSLDGSPTKIYRDKCYAIDINSRTYAYDSNATYNDKITLTSTDSRVKIYSNSNCSTRSSIFTFSTSTTVAYLKFAPAAGDTAQYISFVINAVGDAGNTNTYEPANFNFIADLTTKNTPTKLGLWGPQEIINGQCSQYQVVSLNDNGTAFPVSSATSLSFMTLESSIGSFYSDNYCTNPASSVPPVIASSEYRAPVFFKAGAPTTGNYNLKAMATGFTSATQTVKIKSLPAKLEIMNISSMWNSNACSLVTVGLLDGAGQAVIAPTDIPLSVGWLVNYTTHNIYADSSCGSILSTPKFAAGSQVANFYIRNGTDGYTGVITVNQDVSYTAHSLTTATMNGAFFTPP